MSDSNTPSVIALPNSPWGLPETFPFRMLHQLDQAEMALHTHDYLELVIILKGSATHALPSGSQKLVPGSIFVVKPGQAHGFKRVNNFNLTNICFYPTIFDHPWLDGLETVEGANDFFLTPAEPDSCRTFNLYPARRRLMSEKLDQLFREACRMSPGYELLAKAFLVDLFGFISRSWTEATSTTPGSTEKIHNAMVFIEKNFRENITLEHIAKSQKVSKSALIQYFRTATGCTPIDYLIKIRLQKAIDLFSSSNRSITEIAYAVGFHDSNYFSRQFKKKIGTSPRQYRQQLPIG